jgi:hypothetical protein
MIDILMSVLFFASAGVVAYSLWRDNCIGKAAYQRRLIMNACDRIRIDPIEHIDLMFDIMKVPFHDHIKALVWRKNSLTLYSPAVQDRVRTYIKEYNIAY